MEKTYSPEELNQCSRQELMQVILLLQDQLDRLNENYENLVEQIRAANQNQFGRKTERLEALDGQLSFFNEAEALSDEAIPEPTFEEVVRRKTPRKKGRREEDLKDLPVEEHRHSISEEELDITFGKGNWRVFRMRNSKDFGTSLLPGRWKNMW